MPPVRLVMQVSIHLTTFYTGQHLFNFDLKQAHAKNTVNNLAWVVCQEPLLSFFCKLPLSDCNYPKRETYCCMCHKLQFHLNIIPIPWGFYWNYMLQGTTHKCMTWITLRFRNYTNILDKSSPYRVGFKSMVLAAHGEYSFCFNIHTALH